VLGPVPGVWIASTVRSPRVSFQPSPRASCSYSASANSCTWTVAPVCRTSTPVSRHVVGVVVGLEDVADPHPVQAGEATVRLDYPLRVDHHRDPAFAVGDKVGGTAEVLVD